MPAVPFCFPPSPRPPLLYLDSAAYDMAARRRVEIELANLKRVGMLAKQ